MDNIRFLLVTEQAYLRSKATLMKKEKEYSRGKDRLDQFKRAGSAQDILPTEALIGMATKHFTSLTDMCKEPDQHTTNQWREKLGDLRNYMFLLEALLIDLEVIEE